MTVFSRDLSESAQGVKINTFSKYDLHDLVQLEYSLHSSQLTSSVNTVACIIKLERDAYQIMDQAGSVRTIFPRQISMKIENKKTIATDRDGFELRVGDKVKEIEGELRQGTILHIHHSIAFLHNPEISENQGVFVARTMNLATVAAKQTSRAAVADLSQMNPAMQRRTGPTGSMPPPQMRSGGRDRTIGQTVIIRQGPYKGLLGIVKDSTDTTARVELHSNLKTISIEKLKLSIKTCVYIYITI